MEYKDYYKTLGVPKTATEKEIKAAFRRLARKHHPDVNAGNKEAEARFKEINEANEVLSDPEKRGLYDQLGSNWKAYQRAGAGGPSGGPGSGPFAGSGGFGGAAPGGVRFEYRGDPEDLAGFSDFFRTFFGGGADFNAEPASTRRTRTQTRVRTGSSIEDLLAGMGGAPAGAVKGRAATPARLEATAQVTLEEVASGAKRLLDVDGRRIEVTIPKGVSDGQRIRFSGVATGADAYVKVSVAPHAVFTRDGANLSREVPITLREALLGGETTIKTLTGKLMLRIPPETQTGRTFRLAGQGLPHFRKEGRGDLFARVRVVLPTELSADAKKAAEEFLDRAEGRKQ